MKRAVLAALLSAGLCACASLSGPGSGPAPAQLADCSGGPHCVNSLAADAEHGVLPFYLAQPAEKAWPAIVAAVGATGRTHVVQSDAHYLHAEVVSPWHFYVDDLELMLRDNGLVDVRSSSRIGYYDFNVNRKRVEALRAALAAQGVIAR